MMITMVSIYFFSIIVTIPVAGRLRAAVGKAQLLISKKFPQFKELCALNEHEDTRAKNTNSDLQGFWDFVSFVMLILRMIVPSRLNRIFFEHAIMLAYVADLLLRMCIAC